MSVFSNVKSDRVHHNVRFSIFPSKAQVFVRYAYHRFSFKEGRSVFKWTNILEPLIDAEIEEISVHLTVTVGFIVYQVHGRKTCLVYPILLIIFRKVKIDVFPKISARPLL